MLLSNPHRFIFVHAPKTAGMSIRHALAPLSTLNPRAGLDKQLSRLPIRQSEDKAAFRQHVTARWARLKLPREVFDGYCKFAVVRNPFDRAVSHYHWQSQWKPQRNYDRSQNMSFKDYLADFRRRQRWHDERQVRYLCDRSGDLMVDRLLRFESLDSDFARLAADLGLDVRLPHRNASRHGPYQDHYDDEARAMVLDIFAADFEAFGYDTELEAAYVEPLPLVA